MLFLISCPTPVKNEGDPMAALHSACLRGFVVNSEQPKAQRDPTARREKWVRPTAGQGNI